MVVETFSKRLAVKLTRYRAAKKKHAAMVRRRRKQKKREELRALLVNVRAVLGYKPGGPKGGKLSPEHVAALHAGRDRYHQARREQRIEKQLPCFE